MRDGAHRPLTESERAILEFEASWWTLSGPKDANIRAQLGIAPSTYRRALSVLIDLPAAFRHDPLTVTRVRKAREARRRQRIVGPRADPGRS